MIFEKIPARIFTDSHQASIFIPNEIAELIQQKNKDGKHCVLGLASGSTPKFIYKELVRLHKEEGLSFKNVYSFNLDEYYPMKADSLHSYVRFMKEQLFDQVDIPDGNYFISYGTIQPEEVKDFCFGYEQKIEKLGGLDFQLLGIGGNGHFGFNEPGSMLNSGTRLMMLDHAIRVAAASEFGGQLAKVPKKAITLGIKKILQAKRIVLLAWGEKKAAILKNAIEGPVNEMLPASYLQTHNIILFIIDEGAASELARVKSPWVFQDVLWDIHLIKKAVTILSLTINKPFLKLTNKDYNDNGLSDLLSQYGQAYDINIEVFNQLQHTITGWPGGKPGADDECRPERATPEKKKCLIFSPHPDDDIISMGRTFQRLVAQRHDVHVAYQTSGNIEVADDEAIRFIDYAIDFNNKFHKGPNEAIQVYAEAIFFR